MSDTPNTDVKKTPVSQTYAIDQVVSINAYFDANIAGESVRLQLTARNTATPDEIVKLVTNFIAAYEAARQANPLPTVPVVSKPTQAPATGKKSYEPQLVPDFAVPPELPAGHEYFSNQFDYFVVEPQLDEKVTVSFYLNDSKFPNGAKIQKWKNADAVKVLENIGEIDVTKPNKYFVAGVQYWMKGAEFKIAQGAHAGETSHYKNLKLIVKS